MSCFFNTIQQKIQSPAAVEYSMASRTPFAYRKEDAYRVVEASSWYRGGALGNHFVQLLKAHCCIPEIK
jgi:hypothetical protein